MKPLLSACAALALVPLVSACGDAAYDPRGVEHNETLLSVSASGEADTRPDEARFTAGVENWARSSEDASKETQDEIAQIVAALRELGIEDKDIQTRTVNVQRIDWGDRKGQFQASNTVTVRVRDIAKADAAVTAVTGVGANIVNGPDLRLSDPEKAFNSAYGNAYRAALARAEAYANAAGMKVARVLTIRDAGGSQGNRYLPGAPVPVAPPPSPIAMGRGVAVEQAAMDAGGGATIMPGQTTSSVTVFVDFALEAK
ncbi:SIMPL domain-containing protein [Aurantiacibacter suaedae]|uniref:SIMPL domain-containing protein n=1 Tax=Aurantiacibacter suaedae TaxID=2545755 RepID=UPI0010F9113E|nr:SIMPL domain-containing protein [Aurantiacibacter suaedae]